MGIYLPPSSSYLGISTASINSTCKYISHRHYYSFKGGAKSAGAVECLVDAHTPFKAISFTMEDNSKLTWIYLCQIGYDGLFKIGITNDLAQREAQLKSKLPYSNVSFVGFCHTRPHYEQMLHYMFRMQKDMSLIDYSGGTEIFKFKRVEDKEDGSVYYENVALIERIFSMLHVGVPGLRLQIRTYPLYGYEDFDGIYHDYHNIGDPSLDIDKHLDAMKHMDYIRIDREYNFSDDLPF